MNSLSWFLYLADVLPSLAHGVGFFGFIGVLFVIPIMFFLKFIIPTMSDAPRDVKEQVSKVPFWSLGSLVVIISVLCALVPSRDTIYLIAGSEVGEIVVNSPEAREILNDVKTVIKQQIKDVEEKVK